MVLAGRRLQHAGPALTCCQPPNAAPAGVGAVGSAGQPTEQGMRQGVGSSTFMNVCINKLLAHCAE